MASQAASKAIDHYRTNVWKAYLSKSMAESSLKYGFS